jgi:hypothetical protein
MSGFSAILIILNLNSCFGGPCEGKVEEKIYQTKIGTLEYCLEVAEDFNKGKLKDYGLYARCEARNP